MPDPVPMNNTPEARTPTGELKSSATAATTQTTPMETPQSTTITTTETAGEVSLQSEDTSLLNQNEAGEAKPAGAPETYTDFTVPEGFTLDKAALDKAAPIFKELGLSQEGAQKLMDLYVEQAKASVDKPYQDYLAVRKGWATQLKQEWGNEFAQKKAECGRAIEMLPPEVQKGFREAMDMTGAGDNPAFIKAVHFWASKLTEGKPVTGNGASPFGQQAPNQGPRSAAAAVYPNLRSSTSQ